MLMTFGRMFSRHGSMDFCDVLFGAPKNFHVFSLFEARQRPALAFTSLLKVQLLVGIQAHLGYIGE